MRVKTLVLELCFTQLARLLVLLAVGLLAADAAVFDEVAGRAILEIYGVAVKFTAVSAGFNGVARSLWAS